MSTRFTDSEGKVLHNVDGYAIVAEGTTVPADAATGYATGCIFIHTDGTGSTATYINRGTATSAAFSALAGETSVTLTPTAAETAGTNVIPVGVTNVRLGANVTDANDFTVLPALASVPNGYKITIIAGSAANSELRTPATSAEEINSEDCDGTKEALLTAGNIYTVTKIDNTIGWMLEGRTAIGAFQTAIVPD